MEDREHFVPRRVGEITRELADLPFSSESDRRGFRSFSRLVAALYHFEFHDREQTLIDAWDRAGTDAEAASVVNDELAALLTDANYVEVTPDDLDDAMARELTVPLRLEVDLDDYEELLIHRRDSERRTIEVERWKGLRTEERTITVEDRVVVLTKVRSAEWFAERGIDPAERNLTPGRVSLKQFQQVPRADIEMLLPSTQVRYRPIDKVLVGVPAVASGLAVLATKLLPTLGLMVVLLGAWLGVREEEPEIDQAALVVLFGGLVAIGGFVVRQWTKLKNRRVAYLQMLSEMLYFRTLADGPGVLHTLLSSAEQQEVIEVLLGYRFLLEAPEGLSATELDQRVEAWLHATCDRAIDFDVTDALEKLRSLGLVHGSDRLVAVPVHAALSSLDRRWDALFHHPDHEPASPVPTSR